MKSIKTLNIAMSVEFQYLSSLDFSDSSRCGGPVTLKTLLKALLNFYSLYKGIRWRSIKSILSLGLGTK